MFSLMYRVIFWGVVMALGTQGGYSIYKLRNEMRAKALAQVSRPWPKLPVAPQVDHSINPYIFGSPANHGITKNKDLTISKILYLYENIYTTVKNKK